MTYIDRIPGIPIATLAQMTLEQRRRAHDALLAARRAAEQLSQEKPKPPKIEPGGKYRPFTAYDDVEWKGFKVSKSPKIPPPPLSPEEKVDRNLERMRELAAQDGGWKEVKEPEPEEERGRVSVADLIIGILVIVFGALLVWRLGGFGG